MICLTLTIPNVFLALFLPPALSSFTDVLAARAAKRERHGEKERAQHLLYTHACIYIQYRSTVRTYKQENSFILFIITTINHTLDFSVNHTHTHTYNLTLLPQCILSTHKHTPIHNAEVSSCPKNSALLGSAQQHHNSALCSFLPLVLVLFNNASPTNTQTGAHTLTQASITSTTCLFLSFLLLITVVGPFELFKAVREARKTRSAPKRDDLSTEREIEGER